MVLSIFLNKKKTISVNYAIVTQGILLFISITLALVLRVTGNIIVMNMSCSVCRIFPNSKTQSVILLHCLVIQLVFFPGYKGQYSLFPLVLLVLVFRIFFLFHLF